MSQFSWEKYSSDSSDKGVEIEIEWHDEVLPFRIKRILTIDERQRANQSAVVIGLDKAGRPKVEKQDMAEYTKQTVLVGLKSWPFEYEGTSKRVPITYKTISEVDGGLLDAIAQRILGIVEVDKKDYDPFEMKSGEDSLPEEQAALT